MVGMGEIATLMSSLKGAKDILETMKDLRDTAAFQAKVVELQSKILDAQSAAFNAQEMRAALVQQVRDFETEVARLKAWEREKERYELKGLGNGTLAYAVKDSVRGAEPPHWICGGCYEDAKKSILQPETRFPGRTTVYVCHRCGSELIASGGRDASLDTPRPTHATTNRRPR